MCWAAWVDGIECRSRDALEAKIGMPVRFAEHDRKREDKDHCLCIVDVPGTLVEAGYWVRQGGWDDDHPRCEPGDFVAVSMASEPTKERS